MHAANSAERKVRDSQGKGSRVEARSRDKRGKREEGVRRREEGEQHRSSYFLSLTMLRACVPSSLTASPLSIAIHAASLRCLTRFPSPTLFLTSTGTRANTRRKQSGSAQQAHQGRHEEQRQAIAVSKVSGNHCPSPPSFLFSLRSSICTFTSICCGTGCSWKRSEKRGRNWQWLRRHQRRASEAE